MGLTSFTERRYGAYQDKPQKVHQIQVNRRRYMRNFIWGLVSVAAGAGVLYMLSLPQVRAREGFQILEGLSVFNVILGIGQLVAVAIILAGGLRVAENLVYWLTRRSERIVFYDVGFAWQKGKAAPVKYSWGALKTFRQGGKGWYAGKRPIVQWGRHTIIMRDQNTFNIVPAHGDFRLFVERVGPFIAAETGPRIGEAIRAGRKVKVAKHLTVADKGLLVGKTAIPWNRLTIDIHPQKLVIKQLEKGGKYKPVHTVAISNIQNPGGFLEFVEGALQSH